MSSSMIEVRNLVKKYGNKTIFNNVNLDIKRGESIALIGSNGMGKSTLIKILCGLTRFDSGEIIRDKNIKFNYIPEKFPALNIKAKEYIELIKDIENIKDNDFKYKSAYLYREFNLESMLDINMKNLSKGTLQKFAVIQALLSKPDVLLLDEPLSGQDSNSQKAFIRIVKELIKDNVTVIMSCHESFLIEQLSTRILKIDRGSISEVKNDNMYLNECASMVFYKKERDNHIEIGKRKDIYDYYEDKDTIKFKTKVSESNNVVLEMINNGYILKYFER